MPGMRGTVGAHDVRVHAGCEVEMRHEDYWYVELELAASEQYFELEEAINEHEFARSGVFRVSSYLPLEQRPVSMSPDEIACSRLQPVNFLWGNFIEAMDYDEMHQIENDVEEFQWDCRGQTEQVWG